MRKLEELEFDNTYARLPEAFYERILPTPFSNPHLVSFNPDAAKLIDLDPNESARQELVEYMCGKEILPGAEPIAMLYTGYQFGVYNRRLGDGRAILLGEVRNKSGEKWDLHLKGAGRTRFARRFDGRSVLRSTIREYLCSEAMHHLGIPTTRALCITGSDEKVQRETTETGAMLLRMAPTHVRFGSFEAFYYTAQKEHLKQLADYVIYHHFPHLEDTEDKYQHFLSEVVIRTARLIARWQAVGFAHGVMNTDNMSILGITLDYGPFGFMDEYNPSFKPNHTDHMGRYVFNKQPDVAYWNLECLAKTFSPLISKEQAEEALNDFDTAFTEHYMELMKEKVGFKQQMKEDKTLLDQLLNILEANQIDYTNFFRALGNFKLKAEGNNTALRDLVNHNEQFDGWLKQYRERLSAEQSDDEERKLHMDKVNPKYVLRNYIAQKAIIDAVEFNDYSEIECQLKLFRNPYEEQPGMEEYTAPPPDWSKHLVISCSS